MPAGDGITFSYGEGDDVYDFDPRPLFNYTKEVIKTPANTGLSEKYTVTLNGYLLPPVDLDNYKGGLTNVIDYTKSLREAFSTDFKLLLLQCNADEGEPDDPLISGYPKVVSIDIAPASDNYVRRADYTINLELASLDGQRSSAVGMECLDEADQGNLSSKGLISLTDEFSIEFSDERIGTVDASLFVETFPSVFTITRQMSAQGDSLSCIVGGEAATNDDYPDSVEGATYVEPWQRASGYIQANIGLQPEMSGLTGLMCINNDNIHFANNFRTITVNRLDGIVSSSESWVAYTGNSAAIEELEVNIDRGVDSPFTNVSVNGTIVGLVPSIGYSGECDENGAGPTGTPKFNGAYEKWESVSGIDPISTTSILYDRASKVYSAFPNIGTYSNQAGGFNGWVKGSLNRQPVTETVGYNPIGGTITYGYTFNDRPVHVCQDALSESITYTQNNPTDLFASLTILGRGEAFLQNLNTKEPMTKEVSIDAIIQPQIGSTMTAPISCYNTIMLHGATPEGYYVTNDSVGWEPQQGHFTWSKSWTIGGCS